MNSVVLVIDCAVLCDVVGLSCEDFDASTVVIKAVLLAGVIVSALVISVIAVDALIFILLVTGLVVGPVVSAVGFVVAVA